MNEQYDDRLKAIAVYRTVIEQQKEIRNALVESVKELPQYVKATDMIVAAEQGLEKMTSEVRDLALTEWINTQNKHPHEKIEVKIFKTFKVLDPKRLREWVFTNLPAALSPDLEKVKKYALEIGDVEGTEKGEEPRIQIASKL